MKFKWDKKYLYWGVTVFTVAVAIMIVYFIMFHGFIIRYTISKITKILSPIIIGFVLAYILSPIVNFLEKKVFFPWNQWRYNRKMIRKQESMAEDPENDTPVEAAPYIPSLKVKKRIRVNSIIITMILFWTVVYGLIASVIPEFIDSITNLFKQSGTYVQNIGNWLDDIYNKYPAIQEFFDENSFSFDTESVIAWINQNVDIDKYISSAGTIFGSFFGSIFSGAFGIVRIVLNSLIGVIISVYLLASKELHVGQGKKAVYAIFNTKIANAFIKEMRFIHNTFIGFISGKVVDSIIIGILCFIGTSIMRTPYPLLISVIVGVTNVIPYFGPFLGAIPSALLILLISPIDCLYFIIFILILQQIDGNIIGPKILGYSTGLTSFWVVFAITLFGGIFGIFGMFIGVPLFAIIFAFLKNAFAKSLDKKGMPVDSHSYTNVKGYHDGHFEYNEESEEDVTPVEKKPSRLSKLFSKFKYRRDVRKAKKMKTQDDENTKE